MHIFSHVESFLQHNCPQTSPFLLAFSGGSDSLCLFHCLLLYRKRHAVPFHVAHVDHGWREESLKEAETLQKLAEAHQVPFHYRRLEPSLLKGNLEAACREERYAFFATLHHQISFQAVLTGHHLNDQAETVFKRILEGTHWSRWSGLLPETCLHGVRILRPLLKVTKKEIKEFLARENLLPFEDSTNKDVQFLRARFRESLFPRLNEEFGKEIQNSLARIGEEAQELTAFFEERLNPLLQQQQLGPWGVLLDLQDCLPATQLETKFLLRQFCRAHGFFLSRTLIDQAAAALSGGAANLRFAMGSQRLVVDRRRLFLRCPFQSEDKIPPFDMASETCEQRGWKVWMTQDFFQKDDPLSSWKQGWKGHLTCALPLRGYQLSWDVEGQTWLKKRWNEAKVPAFLYHLFPVIKGKDGICHEFLTGKRLLQLQEGDPCWKITLKYRNTEVHKSSS